MVRHFNEYHSTPAMGFTVKSREPKHVPDSQIDNTIWLEKKRLYGMLIHMRKNYPAKYYEIKREMLLEDKSLASLFRGVEKAVIAKNKAWC